MGHSHLLQIKVQKGLTLPENRKSRCHIITQLYDKGQNSLIAFAGIKVQHLADLNL